MDIRNFFTPVSSTSRQNKTTKDDTVKKKNVKGESVSGPTVSRVAKKTRKAVIASSESDEDPIPSKLRNQRKTSGTEAKAAKRTNVIETDSDSETGSNKNKKKTQKPVEDVKPNKSSKVPPEKAAKVPPKVTKPITVVDFFGSGNIQRSNGNKTPLKRKIDQDEIEIHDDDDFKETVKQLDDGRKKPKLQVETVKTSTRKEETEPVVPRRSPRKTKPSTSQDIKYGKLEVKITKKTDETLPTNKSHVTKDVSTDTPKQVAVSAVTTPDKAADKTLSDEKKRDHGALYRQYLKREGPKAPGSKEIPEGAEGCLQGLTIAITGVLDSLDREEAASLVTKYGGKVTQSISKNTSYVVVGRDAGPAKLEKAEKLGTKQIDEDGLLDLIKKLPGKEPDVKKQLKKSPSVESAKKSSKDAKHPEENNAPESMPKKTPANSILSKKALSYEKLDEKNISPSPKTAAVVDTSSLLWVDKYKPTSTKQIIGQQGDRSNVKKLAHWLQNWHKNNSGSNKKKAYAGRFGSEDGSNFKAALLSGSPGVGKTTTAQLVCKEAGFSYVELNASDTRSKKSLHNIVAEMVDNKSLSDIYSGNSQNNCLIMDEVDGMAGNEDRGGVQELIQLIKNSKIPIICLCNDRGHQKIRSLSNYCFDLRFQKPRLEQLKAAMLTICYKENLNIPNESLSEICISANQDVRQIIHHLFVWSAKEKRLTADQVTREAKGSKKDVKMGPFDVARNVFSASERKNMNIHDKTALFFHDYSIGPLFVQENYLLVNPHAAQGNAIKHMDLVSSAADMICIGDTIDRAIRSGQNWSLLPLQAMFSSVLPGDIMEGHMSQMISFPSWLGCNSSRNKFNRLTQELHTHMRLRISANKTELNCDYLTHIRDAIIRPLVQKEQEGVQAAITVLNKYYLQREDIDSIMDVTLWSKQENPFAKLNSKVKAAFTRTYNKVAHLNPYASVSAPKKRRGADSNLLIEGDEEEVNEEDDDGDNSVDDITTDAMVKVKKQTAKAKGPAKAAPSTSGKAPKKAAAGRKRAK